MCRLFALIAESPVELHASLMDAPAQFHARGHTNPEGWGLGCFDNGEPRIWKRDLPQKGDFPAEIGDARVESRVIVGQVRRASRAPRAVKNTHPFAHDGWIFA